MNRTRHHSTAAGKTMIVALLGLSVATFASAAETDPAAQAINAFGLDLCRRLPAEENLCVSPYSIQAAMAMTYLGASGATRDQMAEVLHFPANQNELGQSFAALDRALQAARKDSAGMSLDLANRLYGQQGFAFREAFLADTQKYFGAPLEAVDFAARAVPVAREINKWVQKQTGGRIRDLVAPDILGEDTRLLLVNAMYFKAAWQAAFEAGVTAPRPFHVRGASPAVDVPTMRKEEEMCYFAGEGFRAVALPYRGKELEFLLIVPDDIGGLAAVEKKLTPALLRECAESAPRRVKLFLPKLKLEPPTLRLGAMLQAMGLTSAFDRPPGSADFDAMAPRKADSYLAISEVLHRTFLELDEKGTEAAAATAVVMSKRSIAAPSSVELRADRPFFFAIRHAPSGACLFMGRIDDPR